MVGAGRIGAGSTWPSDGRRCVEISSNVLQCTSVISTKGHRGISFDGRVNTLRRDRLMASHKRKAVYPPGAYKAD